MSIAVGDKIVFTKDVEGFNVKAKDTGKVTDIVNLSIGLTLYFLEVDSEDVSVLKQIYVTADNCFQVVETLRFMNDYCTTSLWSSDGNGPKEYDELPLSKELVALLEKRDEEYTNRLNWEDPASTPERTEEELKAFEAEGIDLWRRLQEELKPYYKVTFFSEVLRRVVETEAELNIKENICRKL